MALTKDQMKRANEIKKEAAREAKREASWKKQLAMSESKMTPSQKSHEEYKKKLNSMAVRKKSRV